MWHYAWNLYHNKQGPFYLTLEFMRQDAKVVEKSCSGILLWIGIPNLEMVSCKQVAFMTIAILTVIKQGDTLCFTHQWHILHHTFSNHNSADICQGQQPNKSNFRNSYQNHNLISRTKPSWKYNRNNLNHKLQQIFWLYPSGYIQNVQKAIERTNNPTYNGNSCLIYHQLQTYSKC